MTATQYLKHIFQGFCIYQLYLSNNFIHLRQPHADLPCGCPVLGLTRALTREPLTPARVRAPWT